MNAGQVDAFHIALASVFLGSGTPLFDRIDTSKLWLEIVRAIDSPMVTHLRYRVKKR